MNEERCPFCYQPKYLVSGEKWLCLNIESAPATHAFSHRGPNEVGGRGESLIEYLEKYYGLTLEQYHSLRKRAKVEVEE